MVIIQVKNIQIAYDSQVVIENLSFEVAQGQKVAVTGESGKGKSTVLNVLAGFTPFQSGEILIFDKSLTETNIAFIRQHIAWLPQETALQFDSVQEMIYAPFEFAVNTNKMPSSTEVQQMFAHLNLPLELLQKTPATISGGQRQRILLASSLLLKKPLLITDEPTSALDEGNRQRITDYVFAQKDLTVIASTHDNYWIQKSDKIIAL